MQLPYDEMLDIGRFSRLFEKVCLEETACLLHIKERGKA